MSESFKNPYGNVKVELNGMNDEGLDLKAPTPEALEEMFIGIGKIMPTTEQSTLSESEMLQVKVKEITDAIAELEVSDAIDAYRKLRVALTDKADTHTLTYYGELLQKRVAFLTDLGDLADPKRKIVLPLKTIIMGVEEAIETLKKEHLVATSEASSERIGADIKNL